MRTAAFRAEVDAILPGLCRLGFSCCAVTEIAWEDAQEDDQITVTLSSAEGVTFTVPIGVREERLVVMGIPEDPSTHMPLTEASVLAYALSLASHQLHIARGVRRLTPRNLGDVAGEVANG